VIRHVASLVAISVVLGMTAFAEWTRRGRGAEAPRIGVVVSPDWYDRLQLNRAPYDLALARAGANVTTIEPCDRERLERILDRVDGLLLAGGGDVDPALYGGEPGKGFLVDRARDEFEIGLLRRAEARGLPVLGICRGIQVMAVAEGGRLRDLTGESQLASRHGVGLGSLRAHSVRLAPGTRLAREMGEGPHFVNSFHRLAVADPGARFAVAAADEDGVIEAIELPGERFAVALQWHPELGDDRPIRMLVDAARLFKSASGIKQ
jgi:putative glutamine amidotransferase